MDIRLLVVLTALKIINALLYIANSGRFVDYNTLLSRLGRSWFLQKPLKISRHMNKMKDDA